MMRFILVAAALTTAVAASSSLVVAGGEIDGCFINFYNNMSNTAITLCGRQNGGIPGAWYTRTLPPGGRYRRPCQSNAGTSLLTLLSVRNDSTCGWASGCPLPNSGICTYPWQIGEGIGEDGYWYGAVGATAGGAPGWAYTGDYGAQNVSYGVELSCMSYGRTPWNATCSVRTPDWSKTACPFCKPFTPTNGAPNSGVVACGPKNGPMQIYVNIFNVEYP